jgi:hypothetical protein
LEVSELSKSGQAWDTRTCWTEDRRDLACADHKCQIYKAVLSVSCRETDRLTVPVQQPHQGTQVKVFLVQYKAYFRVPATSRGG